MRTYLAISATILGLLALLPFLDAGDFNAPPVLAWMLLAVGVVLMALRGRRRGED